MPNDNTIQPITDDAELAKVLDGMNQPAPPQAGGLNFEETPQTALPDDPAALPMPPDGDTSATDEQPAEIQQPISPVTPAPTGSVSPELDSIKKSALEQLRPLVDKLELPADEKFDTLLLIIRSTDDQSLVNQAYEAAKSIEDETKRAEALLDIIKEIDYFANPQQNTQP